MKKYRPWGIAVVLITLMPFVNFWLASMMLGPPEIQPASWLEIWGKGFGILVFELIAISLPGMLPVVGEYYMAWIGRLLGFPDKELEKSLRDFTKE